MKKTIKVLQTHILKGKRGDPCSCAVALALKKAGVTDARVGFTHINYEEASGYRAWVDIPPKAWEFIRLFDSDDIPKSKLKPFSFQVTIN